ncbi:MAG: hypothetical protein M3N29_04335 [Chloroflexota bacterium]|nr:hypothetical protein [Chloroflexota bacterium]
MNNVVRFERARVHESERWSRFAPLVVAYFAKAIELLSSLRPAPQLATRRVSSRQLASLSPAPREHPWD